MEAAANQRWFLCKHEDGTVFGPLPLDQLKRWASSAQIAPHDKLSTDQLTWIKAPMLAEIGMDWLVEVSPERYYGPTTAGAVQEFVRLGEIADETFVINSCHGTRLQVRDMPASADFDAQIDPAFLTATGAPNATGMLLALQDRIRELEEALREQRAALQEADQRYREIEARYAELLEERAARESTL
jgi:hypothetical protein